MANIAMTLREEIARLSRGEMRSGKLQLRTAYLIDVIPLLRR